MVSRNYSRLFVFVIICWSVVAAYKINFQKLLKDIPENERIDYLKYQVFRAYQEKTIENKTEEEVTTISPSLAVAIYDYYMQNRQVDEHSISTLGNIVCFKDPPVCIDIDDPSIHP